VDWEGDGQLEAQSLAGVGMTPSQFVGFQGVGRTSWLTGGTQVLVLVVSLQDESLGDECYCNWLFIIMTFTKSKCFLCMGKFKHVNVIS
jgi:hypothetical protein